MDEMLYWIWLSLAITPATDNFSKLFSRFQSAKAIYEADKNAIAACITSKSRDYNSLTDKSLDKAEEVLEFCTKRGVGILIYDDEKFPLSLKQIPTPPVLLYYRGNLPDFNSEFFVSVVGTRRLSDYGRRNAFYIAHDLAIAGTTVVSGMAIGIDGVAHAGAIAAGAHTVAVIGSGIDVCYPKQHRFNTFFIREFQNVIQSSVNGQ
jgi:DNA processing protein